uniref:Uncharacterized protein n=1 Tax=Cacopsylla melanoneura TaxID=428564 RepID=A0A8D9BYG1_9HEMI
MISLVTFQPLTLEKEISKNLECSLPTIESHIYHSGICLVEMLMELRMEQSSPPRSSQTMNFCSSESRCVELFLWKGLVNCTKCLISRSTNITSRKDPWTMVTSTPTTLASADVALNV